MNQGLQPGVEGLELDLTDLELPDLGPAQRLLPRPRLKNPGPTTGAPASPETRAWRRGPTFLSQRKKWREKNCRSPPTAIRLPECPAGSAGRFVCLTRPGPLPLVVFPPGAL